MIVGGVARAGVRLWIREQRHAHRVLPEVVKGHGWRCPPAESGPFVLQARWALLHLADPERHLAGILEGVERGVAQQIVEQAEVPLVLLARLVQRAALLGCNLDEHHELLGHRGRHLEQVLGDTIRKELGVHLLRDQVTGRVPRK